MLDFRVHELKCRSYGFYFCKESISGRVVFDTFEDGIGWLEAVKNILENPERMGLVGEWVHVKKNNDYVKIELTGWNDDENYPEVNIKVQSLLKSIDSRFDFFKKGTPEIAFMYHQKEETVEVVDRRSKPELYLIDINKQPVAQKEYDFVLLKCTTFADRYNRTLDNDWQLSMLAYLFTYRQEWTDKVEQALRDNNSNGVTFEESQVIINDQHVTLQPAGYYKPEEYAVTFEKNELLKLIDQWNALASQKIDQILIKRYPNQKIIIEEFKV